MGRGSASSTSQDSNNKSSGPALVLECETEGLSDAQLSRIQKLKDEALRLQNLIQTSATPKGKEKTGPPLVNGTGVPPVTGSITNGPSVVGLQVPQFLILQNGQMIAASTSLPSSSIATTNPANSFPLNSTPGAGSINTTLAFKTSNARTSTSTLAQALTRPQIRVVPLESVSNGKSSSSGPSAAAAAPPPPPPPPPSESEPTPPSSSTNDDIDIQVVGELRAPSQVVAPLSRSLRNIRIQGPSGSPTNASLSVSTTFKAVPSTNNASTTTITPAVAAGTTLSPIGVASASTTTCTTSSVAAIATTLYNKYPLLNIIARPRNTLPPSIAMSQRKDLDTKVKLVLVKSPQEFVEWLLSQGMIRTSQNCNIHKMQHTQQPYKLKLGMFSDPKALATSGGYVWISECCGKKYVSVYSGSIFGSTPIDKVPPTSVLKLVYHWACQTSISNVENWVKVDKTFINKMYQYLRCVCSVMLQDKVYDFGFDGTTVELGIVSLGTSTADGTRKAVKVEILGLYDRKMKSYRLFASEPEPSNSSRQRFVRILKPLERVVHNNALILCDQSVDRNCLYNMNYARVSVCETSDNEDNLQYNAKIMAYLRKHVPKMFQSALSQLNLEQVQLVLDELCWRERYGHCAAQAYLNMIEHITYLTAREAENPGVLHLLDFVAQSPQHNWRYKSQHIPKGPTTLQPSIIMATASNTSPISPQLTIEPAPSPQSPLDHNNKVLLPPKRVPPLATPSPNKVAVPSLGTKADSTELEPFYYGQIQGDSSLGHEINATKFVCHICSMVGENNIDFYAHLKLHLSRTATYGDTKVCCNYCAEHFNSEERRIFHHRVKHMHLDSRFMWCRICTEGFSNEYNLVNHMAKKHYESELPYRCEVCNFVSSIYYSLIDHFNAEHKDTAYVQCHFCLSVKSISPSSSSCFSQRMYQHMQKHTHQHTKCKQCQLTFCSKSLLDEHKKKDHISRVGFPGLQRYKVPAGQKTRIMFRPWIKRNPSAGGTANNALALNTPVALSSILEWHEFKINIDDPKEYKCVECKNKFSLSDHFKSYMKCTRCTFATCCRNMITKHAEAFHPQGRTKKSHYKLGRPIALPKSLFCICGFSTRSGNHMARHLAICEGGRKSAYPSVSDAMVYQGDVTGSMLSLASLGFDSIGSLASILPEDSLPTPSLDMTHFMSVTMDVDES